MRKTLYIITKIQFYICSYFQYLLYPNKQSILPSKSKSKRKAKFNVKKSQQQSSEQRKQMIELYAILHNFEDVLQLQIPNKSNRQSLCSLYKHIEKKIKSQAQVSKLIKSMKIQNYFVYYFRQDQFVFIIVTTDKNKTERVQNYLRVIAEIFYENYDEKKFHIILQRIIKQINRIESPNNEKPLSFQEQETFLGQSPLPQYKQKINSLMEKKDKQSKRVYVIMSVLFVLIFILFMVFLCKKWC